MIALTDPLAWLCYCVAMGGMFFAVGAFMWGAGTLAAWWMERRMERPSRAS